MYQTVIRMWTYTKWNMRTISVNIIILLYYIIR